MYIKNRFINLEKAIQHILLKKRRSVIMTTDNPSLLSQAKVIIEIVYLNEYGKPLKKLRIFRHYPKRWVGTCFET